MSIEVNNIKFSYGRIQALDGVDLSLPGGAVGLLGPNGAGKSTLIRILLGFLVPDEGDGDIFGFDIRTRQTDIRRLIGYMPEDDCLIPGMDAVSFTSYLGELSGMPRQEAMKRAGIGILYMYQMFGGGDLFGPKQFEQFVAPVVQQALDFWHARGFRVVYYPMGNATPHLEPMKELDWDALSLEESRKGYTIDIAEVRRVMGPDRLLLGNMDTELINAGDRDAMLADARYQIRSAGESGRFILSCGTPILPGTPADHVKFFCDLPQVVSSG